MRDVSGLDPVVDDHEFSYHCECESCQEWLADLLADQAYEDSVLGDE